MAAFKCKFCGGVLEITPGATIVECVYCGVNQTLPVLSDDRRANLYDRANHFRRNNEYDKAMEIYERLLNENSSDAEAYWSIILCRYGIEYVEDPMTHKRVPTVNRTQFTSVFDDENYKMALQYADGYQKGIYVSEANAINDIQKGILAISQQEKPFDVFICYKETDANGKRTLDSVLAQDLYYQLTQEGLHVFFARITLEDKIGSAYEPYIFAALNSSPIMVVLGTRPEYFQAVWVKNEWSRYLSLIKNGQKKTLIPAYKDMDPRELPEEFSHLQAQDMTKLGFMQDLIRGIKKILPEKNVKPSAPEMIVAGANTEPLLRRVFMFLEEGDKKNADVYCEKVLDIEPENAMAYVGKLMVSLSVRKQEQLGEQTLPFDQNPQYQKALRFAAEPLKTTLQGYADRANHTYWERCYTNAKATMDEAQTQNQYEEASRLFSAIAHYKDSKELSEACLAHAKTARKDEMLHRAQACIERKTLDKYQEAQELLSPIAGYRNADELLRRCERGIQEIEEARARAEAERVRAEKEKEAARVRAEKEKEAARLRDFEKAQKKKRRKALITAIICVTVPVVMTLAIIVAVRASRAKNIKECYENGNYGELVREYGIVDIVIPDGTTTIKDGAFRDSAVQSVTIPDSVTSIGYRAFYDCDSLTSITIPDSVTSIGDYAFYGCGSLTSVTISDSVTSIGEEAFYNCNNLDKITTHSNWLSFFSNVPTVVITGGTEIGDEAFKNWNRLTSITIPDSVTSIGNSAFYDCDGLTSITIPNSVTSIGDSAFEECDGLTSVIIPDGITQIGYNTFAFCDNLVSVAIPDSVTRIGEYAFRDCDRLTDIIIPDGVTSIGNGAFLYCDGLISITIPNSVISIGDSAFEACESLTSVVFQSNVRHMGKRVFYSCDNLTQITVATTESNFLQNVFSSAPKLKTIVVDGCTEIEANAFQGKSNLTGVVIADSVTSIGEGAFDDCDGLTSITLGKGLKEIKKFAFTSGKITDIYYAGTEAEWNEIQISSVQSDAFRSATIHFNYTP